MVGSERARALHVRYPAVDFHADSLMWARWLGYDLRSRHEPPLPCAALGGHVDIPRLVEGGLGAQFFGLVSVPLGNRHGLSRIVDEQIDVLEQVIAQAPEKIVKARTAADLEAARKRGAIAALLGIEGAHALDGDFCRIDHFARRGLRYLGFVHFSANDAGFPAYGPGRRDAEGLTDFGRELVRKCEALGVFVDLAHLNRRGFLEACAMAKRPPIVSHTGVTGAHAHWRNIDDEQLRAVADKGGVVGIIYYPRYLGGRTIDAVVAHFRHVLNVCGEDTPVLGSDWDGFIIPTASLRDASRLPLLTDALLDAGIEERIVAKILRGNALRLLAD